MKNESPKTDEEKPKKRRKTLLDQDPEKEGEMDEDEVKPKRRQAKEPADEKALKEKKAKLSRKSSAYHVAKKQALKDGLSEEEAVEKAKAVS